MKIEASKIPNQIGAIAGSWLKRGIPAINQHDAEIAELYRLVGKKRPGTNGKAEASASAAAGSRKRTRKPKAKAE